jgi:tetratricopeptide (TPR) repeat protein
LALVTFCVLGLASGAFGRLQSQVVQVEPAELERRKDLIGREVEVDDRVQYFVPRGSSGEDDELQLKRTAVTFLVPKRLRLRTWSGVVGVVVRGVLQRDGGRLVCRVSALDVVADDLERLERGIARLSPKDYQKRKAWARWAERRASEFQDGAKDELLLKRARALEAELLWMEGDRKRTAVDAPQEWLAMAQDARRRNVPEPGPSAWAHRALRAKLAAAGGVADLLAVIKDIESMFPDAIADRASTRINLGPWEAPYAKDAAESYRTASPTVRKALDRRLWADATERLLELQASQDLPAAIAMSERAATQLPEKPDLPARLLTKYVNSYRQNLSSLRLGEVKALSQAYRQQLQQPDEALKVLRDWLNIQREHLSNTDAEGPVALANLYDELLQDRVTAVELLRKAWKIDPNSKEVAEAFRARGFRKARDEWVEASPEAQPNPVADRAKSARSVSGTSQGLLGLTPEEVRQHIGKPNRITYVGSKSQLIEQWIYLDTDKDRFVNLVHAPGELKPRVIAHYALPRGRRP